MIVAVAVYIAGARKRYNAPKGRDSNKQMRIVR
jgi:hypothetical protein